MLYIHRDGSDGRSVGHDLLPRRPPRTHCDRTNGRSVAKINAPGRLPILETGRRRVPARILASGIQDVPQAPARLSASLPFACATVRIASDLTPY